MRRIGNRLVAIVSLTAWAGVAIAGALVGWIAVTTIAFGWQPVVIEGSSMAPAIHRGDVAMIDRDIDRERLAAGTTVVFRSPDGDLVTHRIVAVGRDGRYETRGDANPDADVAPLAPDQVIGAGRLVVPSVGMVALWIRDGNIAPVAAAAVTFVALLVMPSRQTAARRRRTRRAASASGAASDEHDRAATVTTDLLDGSFRRMRIAIALLLGLYVLTTQLGPAAPSVTWTVTVAATAACLVIANLVSRAGGRRQTIVPAMVVVALDLGAAVVAVSVLRPMADEVRWALLVLPILEAAVRFRLGGAMIAWTATAIAYVTVELQRVMVHATAEVALGRLATLVQRSGVVLLVAVPGGYLSDHLLRAAAAHRAERRRAAHRSALLEIVVTAGQELNRLDGGGLDVVAPAATALGFCAVDICLDDTREGWTVHAEDHVDVRSGTLPAPADARTALALACDTTDVVVVDGVDDDADATTIAEHGLAAIVLIGMRGRGQRAVLRAGVAAGAALSADQVNCLQLLAREATVALDNVALVERLRDAHDDLEHQANHDPLTGLANRRRFMERLTQSSTTSAAAGSEIAVLFLDLNRFKAVNDTHGHDVGDELLTTVAERLRRCVRGGDLLARLGGDEFTVLLANTAGEGPILLARRICDAIGAPFRLSGHTVEVSASVGIATGRDVAPTELMRRADAAMYHAKHSGGGGGGGGWFVYDPALDVEASDDAAVMQERLRHALATEQLSIAYQPVVDVATGSIAGFEALARWHDEVLGQVSPEAFIPVAEDGGLIDQLGEWVLRRACEQARTWQVAYERELSIAVNVSPLQLTTPAFADRVMRALRTARLSPSSLVLEVTERVVVGRVEARVLRTLREAGVRVAIDDFGAGQTSLSYLRLLPLDMLKIDRDFVQISGGDRDGVAILRSLLTLGHDLGLEVIAEGVENDEQLELLRSLGCDAVQGFLLHRPLTVAEASAALDTTHRRVRAAG